MKHFFSFSMIRLGLVIFFFTALLFSPSRMIADCNYPNECNMQSQTSDPQPGGSCVINGITTNVFTSSGAPASYAYVYRGDSNGCGFLGWGSGPCVPHCGFLNRGYCCKPKNPSHPAPKSSVNLPPPPCNQFSGTKGRCLSVNTAIGVIPTDIAGFTKSIFSILLGLSGAVAILLIIAAGYQLMTSQGNPEKVKEARERLTAAIVGLLFIIFSVLILQIIGVDILQLPGLGR